MNSASKYIGKAYFKEVNKVAINAGLPQSNYPRSTFFYATGIRGVRKWGFIYLLIKNAIKHKTKIKHKNSK